MPTDSPIDSTKERRFHLRLAVEQYDGLAEGAWRTRLTMSEFTRQAIEEKRARLRERAAA